MVKRSGLVLLVLALIAIILAILANGKNQNLIFNIAFPFFVAGIFISFAG